MVLTTVVDVLVVLEGSSMKLRGKLNVGPIMVTLKASKPSFVMLVSCQRPIWVGWEYVYEYCCSNIL